MQTLNMRMYFGFFKETKMKVIYVEDARYLLLLVRTGGFDHPFSQQVCGEIVSHLFHGFIR